MSNTAIDRLRQTQLQRSFRLSSAFRLGVVALMVWAMIVGTAASEWPKQLMLLAGYLAAAIAAVVVAYTHRGPPAYDQLPQVVFAIVDVVAVVSFQWLSDGGYSSLLVATLLPLMVSLDVSLKRAAIVLSGSVVAFAVDAAADPAILQTLGYQRAAFLLVIYMFLCGTTLFAVNVQARQFEEIAKLSALREALLADTMTASESQRQQISETIHDGPLQDVLAARHAILRAGKRNPDEDLDIAMESLKEASQRLREATFELHPAVLEKAGLDTAVEQLATFTARRSGIAFDVDIDYPTRNVIDPIIFGVVRELVSNIVRHSQATDATVRLAVAGRICELDVIDNGRGTTEGAAAGRLREGHIGLASQRARMEAAGGSLTMRNVAVGTHIEVRVPLR